MSIGNFAPPTQAEIILSSKETSTATTSGMADSSKSFTATKKGFEVKLATKTMLKAVYIRRPMTLRA